MIISLFKIVSFFCLWIREPHRIFRLMHVLQCWADELTLNRRLSCTEPWFKCDSDRSTRHQFWHKASNHSCSHCSYALSSITRTFRPRMLPCTQGWRRGGRGTVAPSSGSVSFRRGKILCLSGNFSRKIVFLCLEKYPLFFL